MSLPKGFLPAIVFLISLYTFEPILSSTPTQSIYVLSSEPMVVDPNPSTMSHKAIHNQHAHYHRKKYQSKVKATTHYLASQPSSFSQPFPSFDQTMRKPLKEFKQGNILHMDKHCDSVHILDFFNLDMEDTLDDSIHEDLIDMDSGFPNILST